MEKYFDMFFMLLGLGFFIWIIVWVEHAEERNYQRKITEAREFGFKGSRIAKEGEDPQPKT